jgi:membrane protease YdiL (CAAX protease family)
MKKILTTLSIVAANVAFALAQAQATINIGQTANQGQVNGNALFGLLAIAQGLVSRLVPFAVGLAVLAFFWFLIEFIWKGRDDAEAKKRSLSGMGYAVLALFVMVSIWGIVGFLGSMFGIGQGGSVPVPGIPTPCPTSAPC